MVFLTGLFVADGHYNRIVGIVIRLPLARESDGYAKFLRVRQLPSRGCPMLGSVGRCATSGWADSPAVAREFEQFAMNVRLIRNSLG